MDQNVRFRLEELERENLDRKDESALLHEKLDGIAKSIEQLLALFNGAKSVLTFARILGRVTIAVAAFVAAFKFVFYVMGKFPWR